MLDAYGALINLRRRPDVQADRIGLQGWSHGGSTTLNAMDEKQIGLLEGGKGFTAAVPFYPGCTPLSKRREPYMPYAPLQMLIGESDDWTPAASCKLLTESVQSRGGAMGIKTYPDTYHDFDSPVGRKRLRTDVPNGVHPGHGVTVAPNPAAREDAHRPGPGFLGIPDEAC